MVQPTSQPVLVSPEAVVVSAVSVDVTLRRRDQILSTVSDSVMVVTEELQSDDWTRSGVRKYGRCRGDVHVVGRPVSAFQSSADGCMDFTGGLPLW